MTDSGNFDSYYAGFWGGKAFRFLDRSKLRLIKSVIASRPVTCGVVDLGCGSGAISAKLVQSIKGIEMICVDGNPSLLEMAEKRGLKTCLADLNKALPCADDSVDVVLMIDSIEHVESRNHIFSEARRVLAPDGVLIVITTPYDTVAWCLGEKMHRLLTGRSAGHISPFTKESMSWLLSVNFSEQRTGYLNGGLTMYGIGTGKK